MTGPDGGASLSYQLLRLESTVAYELIGNPQRNAVRLPGIELFRGSSSATEGVIP